ncbi:tyrosine-type recombinase/integrase [Halocatena marina]|uniref:Tyrosine-type recombinase/integrase n=2 Tax=Halocatena marina TaxID=2934937 RepID=A0ABD5YVF8_9EURY
MAEATIVNQKYHLQSFCDWAEEIELDDVSDLGGYTLNQYKTWRRDTTGVNDMTLYNNLMTIKAFIKWCEKRDLVDDGLSGKLDIPQPDNPVRHATISPDRAQKILDYQKKFQYAREKHVLFYLLYHTGIRIGTANALDIEDWDSSTSTLRVKHRPDTGTPLKNQEDGERVINIVHDELAQLIDDYISNNHKGKEDKYGRMPLFPSRQGRASPQTLRHYIQHMTEPCIISNECPHDRNPSECEARLRQAKAFDCPSAISPHPIRRSAITDHLNKDVPKEVVEERMNVSQKVIDRHYDERTESEKADVRKEHLDDI